MEQDHDDQISVAKLRSTNSNGDNNNSLVLKNKHKLKKLRSIKLNKSPSLKPSSTRRPKSNLTNFVLDLPNDIESPQFSQKSAPMLARRSSFNKGVRTLTRMSSKKLKKPVTKVSRSSRPLNSMPEFDDPSSLVSPPSSSKSVKASPRNSEHSFSGSDRTKRASSIHSKPSLTRKVSLRPLRVSTKTKRIPEMKHTETSHVHDPGVERATCSSALKDSKISNSVQIQHCESEPGEVNSDMKVCPFSYCSLHGHRHRTAPPLKRLISIRKRLLRNDRNVKVENRRDKPRYGNNKVSVGVQTDLVEELDSEVSLLLDTGVGAESVEEEEEVKASELCSPSCIEENRNQTGDFDSLEHDSELIVSKGTESGEPLSREEKENLEPGRELFPFPPRESDPESLNNVSPRMKLKDQKYVKMWRLMYKHAVKDVEDKTQQQQVIDNVSLEDHQDKSCENANERYQIDAVNLVQKAFDEILLPEIQEVQVVSEAEKASEAKTTSDFGDKVSEKKVSKSWSSLKKIFILKKFVKALEKVKMIKRGTPRYLPLQIESEAERVNLRRQASEEKKNAEEWMLDYALQQVVSKLDPEQQRQVAMLVKAFESVLPDLSSPSSPSLRMSVENRTRFNRGSGSEGNFSDVLIGRMFSRGQGTDFLEADSQQQKLETSLSAISNSFSSSVDDTKSKEIVFCGNKTCSLDDKTNSDEKELFDAKKSKSETNSLSLGSAKQTQLERQSYMRLWGYVYKHMMENIPSEEEGTKLSDDNVKTTTTTTTTTTTMTTTKSCDNAKESIKKAVIQRLQAINLIEKAIDDVVLPDNQDSPSPTDGQSTGSDDEPRPKNVAVVLNADQQDNQKKNPEKQEEEVKKSAAPEKQLSKNWSTLKKKILLRRFIKAFENARKFNPRGPRFLDLEAEAEAEKVNLKHQEMDERKNAEEWMVDHALQRAVARLTPARVKKVQLLVEAFETVTPNVRS